MIVIRTKYSNEFMVRQLPYHCIILYCHDNFEVFLLNYFSLFLQYLKDKIPQLTFGFELFAKFHGLDLNGKRRDMLKIKLITTFYLKFGKLFNYKQSKKQLCS